MSNRKKTRRKKIPVPPPQFPRVRIRERTGEEVEEITRKKHASIAHLYTTRIDP